MRDPHARVRIDGGECAAMRAAADHADRDAIPQDRLPRLPRRGARRRGEGVAAGRPGRARGVDPAQPRRAGGGPHDRRGVQLGASARVGVPHAARCDGHAGAAEPGGARCARGHVEQLPTRHAPALWPDGVARAAAQARPARCELPRVSTTHTHPQETDMNAKVRRTLWVAAFGVTLASSALAQAWPEKPVRVVVAFTAGGTTDILARNVGQQLSERLKQPFVIDNKPGAGGNLGTELVVRAPADGYTLIVNS